MNNSFANCLKNSKSKETSIWRYFNIHLHVRATTSIRRLIQRFPFAILWMFQLVRMLPMCTICWLNLHHRFVDGPDEHVHGMVYSCKSIAKNKQNRKRHTISEMEIREKEVSLSARPTYRIPFDQMCLFKRVSIRTSLVRISFSANLRISLMARGARFLKPILCTRFDKWMVHSRVTTSLIADLFRFSTFGLAIFIDLTG